MAKPISAQSRTTRQVRLPGDLDQKLLAAVEREDTTITEYMTRALEHELEREGGKKDG